MKILHTITCTRYSSTYGAHVEFTRHLIRSKRLSERGIQRMFSAGCEEYDADPSVCVCRVETAVYSR